MRAESDVDGIGTNDFLGENRVIREGDPFDPFCQGHRAVPLSHGMNSKLVGFVFLSVTRVSMR